MIRIFLKALALWSLLFISCFAAGVLVTFPFLSLFFEPEIVHSTYLWGLRIIGFFILLFSLVTALTPSTTDP